MDARPIRLGASRILPIISSIRKLSLKIRRMGYQGPLIKAIFPAPTDIHLYAIRHIQVTGDLFPALKNITWDFLTTTVQVASLVHHDVKTLNFYADYEAIDVYAALWTGMGGYIIDGIYSMGHFLVGMHESASEGSQIFPEAPSIRRLVLW
jgi:hypothetical protein